MLLERILQSASRIGIVLLSVALFVFSLTQTGFVTPGWWKEGTIIEQPSWALLTSGWLALPVFLVAGIPAVILFFSIVLIVLAILKRSRGDIKILSMIAVSMIVWMAVVAWFDPSLLQAVGWGAWLANPGMVLAWVFFLLDRSDRTFNVSLVSFVLMSSFLFVQEGPFGPKLETNSIIELGSGYWIWMMSAVVMVAASFPLKAARELFRSTFIKRL
jgi:hypothetical protein